MSRIRGLLAGLIVWVDEWLHMSDIRAVSRSDRKVTVIQDYGEWCCHWNVIIGVEWVEAPWVR